jgi:predicted transglutaminase-like cysteine proteinase
MPFLRNRSAATAVFVVTLYTAFGAAPAVVALPISPGLKFFTTVVEDASPPKGWIQFCRDFPADCENTGGTPRTPELTPEKRAQIETVNRAVNREIKPKTDLQNYGVREKWTYPNNGYGDCEDYALLKKRRLVALGWPPESLHIAIVWNKKVGHSVLLARTDQGEFVLDNLRSDVRLWSKTGYDFVKRQSKHDPNKWVYVDGDHYTPASVAGR